MNQYYLLIYDYDDNFVCYFKDDMTHDSITFTYDFNEAGFGNKYVMDYVESLLDVQCLHNTLNFNKSTISYDDFHKINSDNYSVKIITREEVRKIKIKKLFEE